MTGRLRVVKGVLNGFALCWSELPCVPACELRPVKTNTETNTKIITNNERICEGITEEKQEEKHSEDLIDFPTNNFSLRKIGARQRP